MSDVRITQKCGGTHQKTKFQPNRNYQMFKRIAEEWFKNLGKKAKIIQRS